jgi:hypothetical protein
MIRQPPKFKEALEVLARHEVDFIVVGGVAAVLEGAPISTFDLDIVHDRSPENVARLLAALADLDARYRDLAGRILRPEARGLEGEGHHLLLTRCGPLDVLGRIGHGHGYHELIADSTVRQLGEYSVHVLGLEALIRTKLEAGRDKDRAVLAILRRTLEERGE